MSADFDRSGTITGIEALMLGFALSIDAFGAGIGAVMLGFSPIYLAITVAVMSSLFVLLGIKSGSFFHKISWIRKVYLFTRDFINYHWYMEIMNM